MALYEYQCRSCGNVFEVIQRMSDDPLSTCEECGGELKKLVSAPAFQFKGSGWYVTDYGKGSDKGGDKGGGKDTKGSEGGGSKATADSKSDSGDSKTEKKSSDSPKPTTKTKTERIASG